jgi:hypothetical protein
MDPATREALRAAEAAVAQLVEQCCKSRRLYRASPKVVAQVSFAQYLL